MTSLLISAGTVFWKWAIVGALLSGILLATQAAAVGGVYGLLQVGETSELRQLIESELGPVPLAPGPGHDGQIYYAIGLDLFGDEVPDLLDHAAYRYRRILFPLLSSLGGVLEGGALVWGMLLVTVVSFGLAAGVVATLAHRSRRSEWVALVILANPGLWVSVRLLEADTLALALMTVGLYALLVRPRSSWLAFTGSVLAKDAYVVTPGGLGATEEKWSRVALPIGALLLWMAWLSLTMGEGFSGRGNFALPFMGLVEASDNWRTLGGEDLIYLGFALASVFGGLVYSIARRGPLRWSIMGWSLLGLVSSNWVWDFGNNAARVFAPILVLVALSPLMTLSQAEAEEPAWAR